MLLLLLSLSLCMSLRMSIDRNVILELSFMTRQIVHRHRINASITPLVTRTAAHLDLSARVPTPSAVMPFLRTTLTPPIRQPPRVDLPHQPRIGIAHLSRQYTHPLIQ